MNNFIKRIILALATGYILFFFSELVFWSFWRPDNTVSEYAFTWIAYSIMAYIFLLIVHEFRARTIWALFLAGAAFGWLSEGVLAMTLFGVEGFPLPFTISWTGLAWHALISVLLGWYYVQLFLSQGRVLKILFFAAGLGFFWGFSAQIWTFETPPIVTSMPEFAIFAFATTFLFILGHIIYTRLARELFQPTKAEKIIFPLIAVLYFAFITIPAEPVLAPTVLPLLFGLLYLGLRKNKLRETEPGLIKIAAESISFKQYLLLFVMPAMATATYSALFPVASILQPNFVVLITLTSLGFVFLFISLYRMFFPKKLSEVVVV